MTGEAQSFVENATNSSFVQVPAYADSFSPSCNDVQLCCTDGRRFVQAYGNFSCVDVKVWYQESRCCISDTSKLTSKWSNWPTYYHMENTLYGKIKWVVDPGVTAQQCANQNLLMLPLMQRMLDHVNKIVTGTVQSATYDGYRWSLVGDDFAVSSKISIFANGGFGAAASSEELAELGVYSNSEVHGRNTGILWQTAKAAGWPLDPLNAWYLEFVNGMPQWFLWDDRATVLAQKQDGSYSVVYDESEAYDSRGRSRREHNVTDALYIVRDPSQTSNISALLGSEAEEALKAATVPKTCDTRSKRLWRNFIPTCYNYGVAVNMVECSTRVQPADPVRVTSIKQGIIDTISGPVVDRYQNFHPAGWAAGNAASPGLIPMYVGPGSTLGNALMTGYIAAKSAAVALSLD